MGGDTAARHRPVYTIGHSTRPVDDFVALLRAHGVSRVIDVRTVPRSRTNPQFNRDSLPQALQEAGIGYEHVPALGGLRRPTGDPANTGWRNASFRGYADYMQTREFRAAVRGLVARARTERLALMCAEAVPWRCHRSLIADALVVRGIPVTEIIGPRSSRPHTLTAWAKVDGTRITYPPAVEIPEEEEMKHE